MGQYYLLVNCTKKQFIKPHDFGDGAKLLEFGSSGCGVMTGLAILLASRNGRGGGDLRSTDPVVGSWAGDAIVIAGDYGDEGEFTQDPKKCLYSEAYENYENISEMVINAMKSDYHLKKDLEERGAKY